MEKLEQRFFKYFFNIYFLIFIWILNNFEPFGECKKITIYFYSLFCEYLFFNFGF